MNASRVAATMMLRQGVNGVAVTTDCACALRDYSALAFLVREGDPATGTT